MYIYIYVYIYIYIVRINYWKKIKLNQLFLQILIKKKNKNNMIKSFRVDIDSSEAENNVFEDFPHLFSFTLTEIDKIFQGDG
jgi:hypothetical protein